MSFAAVLCDLDGVLVDSGAAELAGADLIAGDLIALLREIARSAGFLDRDG